MMNNLKWLLVSFFLLYCSRADAQDNSHAAFTADRGAPAIGEPIQLTLTVEVPVQSIVTIPQFPEDWPPFMVRRVGDTTVTTEDNHSIYRQSLTVILWQPGDYQTPETIVTYHAAGANQESQIRVAPMFFTVPSVLNDNNLALRPLKPPVPLPYVPTWLIAIMLVCGIGAGLGVGYFVRTRKLLASSPVAERASNSVHISAQIAFEDLKRIHGKVISPPDIYSQTANCLRVYLHGRYEVRAYDMTTGEVREGLRSRMILPERRQRELENLLERADLVKFAHLQPKLASAQQFLSVAQRWIESIEQTEGPKNA